MASKERKVENGYIHCLVFFEDNYKDATLDQKNWFLRGVLTLKDYLEQK